MSLLDTAEYKLFDCPLFSMSKFALINNPCSSTASCSVESILFVELLANGISFTA